LRRREGGKPTAAGIDPKNLLIDLQTDGNMKSVKIGS
jgi:hypothetical protein